MTSPATEFRVNTAVLFNQTMPVAATLSDGTVIVAWTDTNPEGRAQLRIQHFDAQGNTLGANGIVAENVALYESAAIDSLAGGGFVISWQTYDGDIHAQRYSANLMAQGEFQVNTTTVPIQHQDNQAITGLNDGGFLVTWRSENGSNGYQSVLSQRYDANGAPVGGEGIVESVEHVSFGNAVTTALYSGGWLVAWQHDSEVVMRRYDAGGQSANGTPQLVAGPDASSTLGYELAGAAALYGGGWVVLYEGNFTDLYAQRYDASGAPIGGATLIAQPVVHPYDQLPGITGLPNGGYVVTWEQLVDGQGDIHAQVFAADGTRMGAELAVNSYTEWGQTSPTVTALQDGGFLIAWDTYDADGSGSGVYAKRYDANGVPQSNPGWLDGTAGNDSIQSPGNVNARLSGFDGNDTLAGGSGSDTIDGGAGNDVLIASSGVSTYTGGTGVDTASFNFSTAAITAVSRDSSGAGTVWVGNDATGLAEVERAQFTDGLFAVDTQAPINYSWPGGNTWWAAADFHLAFGSIPGIEELSRWTARADQLGGDPAKLAQAMIDTYAPGVSNHDLVTYVLQQVNHEAPTDEQVQNYERLMAPNPPPNGGSAPYFNTQGDFVEYMIALNADPIVGFTGSTPQLDPGWFA